MGAGAIGLGVHLLASSASAQTPGNVPGEDGGYLQWAIALGLGVVVCATAFLNPKRSHMTEPPQGSGLEARAEQGRQSHCE